MRHLPRRALNTVVVAVGLMATLPAVAIGERLRPGSGRRVAVAAIRAIGWLCGIRFVVTGAAALSHGGPYVFVPNHSSPLDIPAVLLAQPDVRFVAAAELFSIPLLASAMRALNTVPVERRSGRTARRQLSGIHEGGSVSNVAIFAEGGIAPAGRRLPFRSGAFVVAIESAAAVVPVAIHGVNDVLPHGARLSPRPGTVRVELLAPIPTAGLSLNNRKDLRDRTEACVLAALGAPAPPQARAASGAGTTTSTSARK